MKPVAQTKFSNKEGTAHGNCLQAVIASILELDIDEVIDTSELCRRQAETGLTNIFWPSVEEWLLGRGYYLNMLINHDWVYQNPDVFYILSGESPRFPGTYHSVVGCAGNVVWDPHPDYTGVVDIAHIMLITHINTEFINDRGPFNVHK